MSASRAGILGACSLSQAIAEDSVYVLFKTLLGIGSWIAQHLMEF